MERIKDSVSEGFAKARSNKKNLCMVHNISCMLYDMASDDWSYVVHDQIMLCLFLQLFSQFHSKWTSRILHQSNKTIKLYFHLHTKQHPFLSTVEGLPHSQILLFRTTQTMTSTNNHDRSASPDNQWGLQQQSHIAISSSDNPNCGSTGSVCAP